MPGVEIGTLRLRGPPHLATRAAFRIEDGLRTELSDTQRLVLIRRMRPGGRAASGWPEERSGAIRRAYEAATRDARHGLAAGDGAFVNCVWFESPAEARRLLLAELLAGRRPTGWFWRMAVPEWRGRPLEPWLSEIVASALGGGEERESLALVLFALEHSDIDLVVRAVQAGAPPSPPPSPPPAPIRLESADQPGLEEASFPEQPEGTARLLEAAEALRIRLPEPMRLRIESLARRLGPGRNPVLRLLERLLLKGSPALALAPAQLRQLASAWSELIEMPSRSPARPPGGAGARPIRSPGPAKAAASASPGPQAAPHLAPGEAPAGPPGPGPGAAPERIAEQVAYPEAPLCSPRGCTSNAAGLWLVIPALIRLGFREWLCERPDLLGQDCGRTLIRTLARHHRVPEDDPTLAAFESLGEIGEAPDWALCWRAGLDRWLRRRARIPLHRLVWKRGEVAVADEALTVRFPPEAADIRLRRRALDVDPGWVDWLGLAIRYRYDGKAR